MIQGGDRFKDKIFYQNLSVQTSHFPILFECQGSEVVSEGGQKMRSGLLQRLNTFTLSCIMKYPSSMYMSQSESKSEVIYKAIVTLHLCATLFTRKFSFLSPHRISLVLIEAKQELV